MQNPITVCRSLLIACMLLAASANAQDTAPLRYQFAEGDTLRFRVTQTASLSGEAGNAGAFETQTEQVAELAWKVIAVDGAGQATIEQSVPKLRFKNTSPAGEVGFDSESDDPPMGVAAMLAPAARTLLATPVEFTVSPQGEVGPIQLTEDLLGSLNRIPGASEVVEGEQAVRTLVEAVLPLLPEGEAKATRTALLDLSSVGKVTLKTVHQLGPVEESGVALVLASCVVEPESAKVQVFESSGIYRLSAETGRLIAAESKQTIKLTTGGAAATLKQQTRVAVLGSEESPAE